MRAEKLYAAIGIAIALTIALVAIVVTHDQRLAVPLNQWTVRE